MNTFRTFLCFSGARSLFNARRHDGQLRSICSVVASRSLPQQGLFKGTLNPRAEGTSVLQHPPWAQQHIRTVKRGTEYQPNNIKRKRTHGWIKRISSRGGIEIILRRMLKGRKSLTH